MSSKVVQNGLIIGNNNTSITYTAPSTTMEENNKLLYSFYVSFLGFDSAEEFNSMSTFHLVITYINAIIIFAMMIIIAIIVFMATVSSHSSSLML